MSTIELVASGYSVVEAPVVDPDGVLYFSNVHDGGVHRLRPGGEPEIVIPRRRGVGGLCLHAEGGLVASGRDVSHIRDGATVRTLVERADLPLVAGHGVGGFNDLCADPLGRVLVGPTRPLPLPPGSPEADGKLMATGTPAPSELLLLSADGRVTVLYDDVRGVSNGIAVSRDGTTVYHAESGADRVRVSRFVGAEEVEVVDMWSTSAIPGHPDGLALDTDGHVWVAMYGGGCVGRFDAGGELVERIEVPATGVTNLCFFGEDNSELYVTSIDNTADPQLAGSIFRVRGTARGADVPLARI